MREIFIYNIMEIDKLKKMNIDILYHLIKITEISEFAKDDLISIYPKYLQKVKLYEWIVEAQKNI